MASHRHGRAKTDRRNMLPVFNKHFNLQGDCCSLSVKATQDSTSVVNLGMKTGRTLKVKRLKTHKERAQLRGWKRHESKQHHRHHGECKSKPPSCCNSRPRHSLARETNFARVIPVQEPCIITGSRLIGHRGLFNHEVKSVDIERLLSDQSNTNRGQREEVRSKGRNNSNTVDLPSCHHLSPGPKPCACQSYIFSTSKKNKQGRDRNTQSNAKTGQLSVSLSRLNTAHTSGESVDDVVNVSTPNQLYIEESGEGAGYLPQSNARGKGPCTMPGQKKRDRRCFSSQSSENEHILQSSTSSSRRELANKSKKLIAGVKEKQCTEIKEKTFASVFTPQHPPKDTEPLNNNFKPGEPNPKLSKSDPSMGAVSCEATKTSVQEEPEICVTAPVASVVSRLCQTLKLPLRRRRCLLAETREVLLQALKERHGPELQGNLLKVQHCLLYNPRLTDRDCTDGQTGRDERWTDSSSDIQTRGPEKVPDFEQPLPSSLKSNPQKRRRKQKYPQKVEPQRFAKPPHGRDLAIQYKSSLSIKETDDLSAHPLRACSPPFLMDFKPFIESPANLTTPVWESQTGFHLPWGNPLTKETVTATSGEEKWMFDNDLRFSRQPKTMERTRQPFLQCSSTMEDPNNIMHWPQLPRVSESRYLNESPPFHHSLKSLHLRPYYSSQHPAPTPRFNRNDLAYYPPSELLESMLSPPVPPYTLYSSPEGWAFPRMRLY